MYETAASQSPVRGGPAGRRAERALLRAVALAACFVALSATEALAQIYVIEKPDGSRVFTNQPVEGAKVFSETHFTRQPESEARTGDQPFQREIDYAAGRAGIDAKLVEAVIATESAFDRYAVSKKGAQGLMQLMPETADRYGVVDVWDPGENINAGAAYLRELIDTFKGDLRNVLAAYNAGSGAVTRHGGIPPYPETREYVDRVLSYYRAIGGR